MEGEKFGKNVYTVDTVGLLHTNMVFLPLSNQNVFNFSTNLFFNFNLYRI